MWDVNKEMCLKYCILSHTYCIMTTVLCKEYTLMTPRRILTTYNSYVISNDGGNCVVNLQKAQVIKHFWRKTVLDTFMLIPT